MASSRNERSPRYQGWRVVFACSVMALFAWGLGFYGHAVYLVELTSVGRAEAERLSTSSVSLATTLYYLVSAVLVAFVSNAVEKLGSKVVSLAGAVALALSVYLIGSGRSPFQLLIAYLIMSIGWAALTIAAITNILGQWFVEKRGLAISLALNGASAGGIVIAPILVWMTGRLGFERAMQSFALLAMAVLALTVVGLMRTPPVHAAIEPSRDEVSVPMNRRTILGTLRFWTIAAPFALGLTAQVGYIVHQVAFLLPSLGRDGAAAAVAITTTCAVVGRVALGLFIDRLDQRDVTALSLVSQAAALTLALFAAEPSLLFLSCAIFGASVGNLITLPALIVQREYPSQSFGMLTALVISITQVSYSFGPGLLGVLRDLEGSYRAAIVVCILMQLIGAAVVSIRVPKS